MCTALCTKFSSRDFALGDLETLAFLSESRMLRRLPFSRTASILANDLLCRRGTQAAQKLEPCNPLKRPFKGDADGVRRSAITLNCRENTGDSLPSQLRPIAMGF